jgi:hypothetical protein
MFAVGPSPTWRRVRFLVAIRGTAVVKDIEFCPALDPIVSKKSPASRSIARNREFQNPKGRVLESNGNVTGLSIQAAETTGKRIELLREALHTLSRLAIMGNGNNSAVVVEMRETQAAADKLGLNATTFEIRRSEDIGPAFEKIRGHFDALFVPAEPLANTNRRRISSFALAMHLPTSFGSSEYVEVGGLMLDEATSAIDVATEHKILKRMVDLNPRPTIVMIAHRDQSLAYCDRVLRFENSRFVTDEPPGTV